MQLRKMTPAEFDVYRRQLIIDYAAEHVRAGTWNAEDAQALATADIDRSLPDGPDTAEELLLTAQDDQGPVGVLWLSLKHPRGVADTAWISDIEILPQRRGQGLGRLLLVAAEEEISGRNISALGLNVFGDNEIARNLYQSAGYRVVTQQMVKRLS
jgi:ribosomal protein S18 acetylase RimI-like enzyme